MKLKQVPFSVFIIGIILLVVISPVISQTKWEIFQLTNNNYISDWGPSVHDSGVAWISRPKNGETQQVYYWDNNEIHKISNSSNEKTGRPCLWNGTIAWREKLVRNNKEIYYEIFYWDGNEIKQITDNKNRYFKPGAYGPPSLWNGEIAFRQWEGSYSQVYFYNGTETRNFTNNSTNCWGPSYNNRQLAWKQVVTNNKNNLEIFFWDGVETRQISNNNSGGNGVPSLSNGQIAYRAHVGDRYELFFWDGKDTHQITNGQFEPREYPSLDNGKIAWSGWDGNDYEIYCWDGYDIIQITDNNADDRAPTLYGNRVAWESITAKGNEIFIAKQTGSVMGNVTDKEGYPIESAKIKLKDKTKKILKKTTSDKNGFFTFTDLSVDTYEIITRKKGCKKNKQVVTLENGEDADVRVEMKRLNEGVLRPAR